MRGLPRPCPERARDRPAAPYPMSGARALLSRIRGRTRTGPTEHDSGRYRPLLATTILVSLDPADPKPLCASRATEAGAIFRWGTEKRCNERSFGAHRDGETGMHARGRAGIDRARGHRHGEIKRPSPSSARALHSPGVRGRVSWLNTGTGVHTIVALVCPSNMLLVLCAGGDGEHAASVACVVMGRGGSLWCGSSWTHTTSATTIPTGDVLDAVLSTERQRSVSWVWLTRAARG